MTPHAPTPTTRLTRLLQRLSHHYPKPNNHSATPEPLIGNGTNPDPDTADPTGQPAHGYPHHHHPIGHQLTLGQPNRGDELTFIDTEIARAHAAGILDEGTLHYLDHLIDTRSRQWHHAIDIATRRHHHLADSLIATATYYHRLAHHDLDTTRALHAATTTENTHWRALLTGHTPHPNTGPDTPQ